MKAHLFKIVFGQVLFGLTFALLLHNIKFLYARATNKKNVKENAIARHKWTVKAGQCQKLILDSHGNKDVARFRWCVN